MPDTNPSPSEFLESIARLTRDLRNASVTLSDREARFLTDSFYQMQRDRIRAGHQNRTLEQNAEPHDVLLWLQAQRDTLEKQIARALDAYSDSLLIGRWARCAPPGALVEIGQGKRGRGRSQAQQIPIEQLRDGDTVTSYNRHHACLTSPRPVTVGMRPYSGNLITVMADDLRTETTPNHKWVVRLNRRDVGLSVYLMRSGNRFRVGRTNLFVRRGEERWRLAIQPRARSQQAEVWVLKLCSTEAEAAIYEQYVSTEYGITEWPFIPPHENSLIGSPETAALFSMLNETEQCARAARCLADHGRSIDFPLYRWDPTATKQSGTQCMTVEAVNLIPDIMEVPVPLRQGAADWMPIRELPQRHYDGPVYSLDVAQHHTYIQDGMITHNSQIGIGPIIAAGLACHIDIKHAPTVGHIWRFAGLDPTVVWKAGQKRPWNGSLKRLCFLIGESFVKVSGNPDAVYGIAYTTRKQREIEKNERGDFADQAAVALAEKRWRDDTQAKKHYESGRLPPARIHMRAKRWAVKLFLSNYHEVLYFSTFGKLPPLPYIMAKDPLLHTHFVEPPNADMVPGLSEARRAFRQGQV